MQPKITENIHKYKTKTKEKLRDVDKEISNIIEDYICSSVISYVENGYDNLMFRQSISKHSIRHLNGTTSFVETRK